MPKHLIVWTLAAALTGGCASRGTDLIDTGYLRLDSASGRTPAHAPRVSDQGGNLVVDGLLDPEDAAAGENVDITITGPDGRVVFQSLAARSPAGRGSGGKPSTGPRGAVAAPRTRRDTHATYWVQFPGLPPQGSTVCVTVQPGVDR